MFERMLIDKIENRILVGIVMFLGIMLLVGWVAINETARMSSFERQFEARAIERGARLFNTNCSGCHGIDGRGIVDRAPGLNNPHLFGYDYFATINRQIASLNTQITEQRAQLNDIDAELVALNTEALAPETTDERFNEIQARIQEISDLQAEVTALQVEASDETTTEERQAEIQTRLTEVYTTLYGNAEAMAQVNDLEAQLQAVFTERDALVNQFTTAVDNGFPLTVNDDGTVNQPARLTQMGWAGTLHDYIYTTLVHGRPGSANWWASGEGMASWAQLGGGPLRADQVEDIVSYILNFEPVDDWSVEDALVVNQFGVIPGAQEIGGPPISDTISGTDYVAVQAIAAEIATLEADPVAGEAAYRTCSGCHLTGAIGPMTDGTWDRVVNDRLNVPQFAGYTAEEYVIESVINPTAFFAPGFENGGMPEGFSDRLTLQQLADIIAFLRTQSSQPIEETTAPATEATAEATAESD